MKTDGLLSVLLILFHFYSYKNKWSTNVTFYDYIKPNFRSHSCKINNVAVLWAATLHLWWSRMMHIKGKDVGDYKIFKYDPWRSQDTQTLRDSKRLCRQVEREVKASRTALVHLSAFALALTSTACWARWASQQRRPRSRWCTRPWTRRAGCDPKPWRQISTPLPPEIKYRIHETSRDSLQSGLNKRDWDELENVLWSNSEDVGEIMDPASETIFQKAPRLHSGLRDRGLAVHEGTIGFGQNGAKKLAFWYEWIQQNDQTLFCESENSSSLGTVWKHIWMSQLECHSHY